MDRLKIEEMIVVEGKNDTNTLRTWFRCDTIETNGSAVNEETLRKVRRALEKRGVIVFTDPDFPGEKIRKTIDREVPGCKHAFLPKEAAVDVRKNKVGIEHARREDLLKALQAAKPSVPADEAGEAGEVVSRSDLQKAGLIAGDSAKKRREELGKKLNIGYTNGKQLYNRLIQFKVTKAEFEKALASVEKELES